MKRYWEETIKKARNKIDNINKDKDGDENDIRFK